MKKLLSILLLPLLLASCEGGAPKLNTGDKAPAFSAVRADGVAVTFPGDYVGKPVVIRFWADWCRYCEGEMKLIENVYLRRKSHGLEVLAINAGQDRETVLAFMRKIGASYPALLDRQSEIARSYGVVGLPTTYFIGADGVVKSKVVGEADEATFDRRAQELLR